jgi:uncharacterized protein (TIGR03437 family)
MQKLKLSAGSFLTALFLFPAFCPAQTITIVSGDGQLVCPDCAGTPGRYVPLVVQVNNAAGQPAANTTVTWTATQSGYSPVISTTETNSTGQATYTFEPLAFFFGSNYLPATIVASALSVNAQFVETTVTPNSSGAAPVFVNLVPAGSTPKLSGLDGQTATTSLTVSVVGLLTAIPGVAVSLQSGTGNQPSVSCASQPGLPAGVVLTNSAGIATCAPVFGNVLGQGSYTLVVGGNFVNFGATGLTVSEGPPAIIKIISGNNQTVNAGTQAPASLLAEVTDLGGNPSNAAAVKWTVTKGTATLSHVVTSTLSTGDVSATVTPTAGPVQVTLALASNSAVNVVFTVNVTNVVTGVTVVSGNNQTAEEGTSFPEPLIVQVNDNAAPAPDTTVNFVVSSGSATLSAASAVTNAQGQAQVTAKAGSTAGPVVVTATVGSAAAAALTATFDLTVGVPYAIITKVVNSAGFQNEFLSPCSLATIYGTGLATGLQGVAAAFIEPQTQVSGVTVTFGGVLAPILDVANVDGVQSVSVQVPCEVPSSSANPPATVSMVVTVNGAASPSFPVTVLPISPGIFQFTDSDGQMRAVLVRQDGTFISVANPARPGDTLRMFATGLGQTTPTLFTNEFDPLVPETNGDMVPATLTVNSPLVVGVDNGGVLVLSAKYAYGMVGVYEIEFQVPENAGTGNSVPFAIFEVYNGTDLQYGEGSLIPIQ